MVNYYKMFASNFRFHMKSIGYEKDIHEDVFFKEYFKFFGFSDRTGYKWLENFFKMELISYTYNDKNEKIFNFIGRYDDG